WIGGIDGPHRDHRGHRRVPDNGIRNGSVIVEEIDAVGVAAMNEQLQLPRGSIPNLPNGHPNMGRRSGVIAPGCDFKRIATAALHGDSGKTEASEILVLNLDVIIVRTMPPFIAPLKENIQGLACVHDDVEVIVLASSHLEILKSERTRAPLPLVVLP